MTNSITHTWYVDDDKSGPQILIRRPVEHLKEAINQLMGGCLIPALSYDCETKLVPVCDVLRIKKINDKIEFFVDQQIMVDGEPHLVDTEMLFSPEINATLDAVISTIILKLMRPFSGIAFGTPESTSNAESELAKTLCKGRNPVPLLKLICQANDVHPLLEYHHIDRTLIIDWTGA